MNYSTGVVAFKFDHEETADKAQEVLKIRRAVDEMCDVVRKHGGQVIPYELFQAVDERVERGELKPRESPPKQR